MCPLLPAPSPPPPPPQPLLCIPDASIFPRIWEREATAIQRNSTVAGAGGGRQGWLRSDCVPLRLNRFYCGTSEPPNHLRRTAYYPPGTGDGLWSDRCPTAIDWLPIIPSILEGQRRRFSGKRQQQLMSKGPRNRQLSAVNMFGIVFISWQMMGVS